MQGSIKIEVGEKKRTDLATYFNIEVKEKPKKG